MNKLATALLIPALATVLIGCSSGGSSTTPAPQNVSGTFSGTWDNTPGTQDGTASFNLSQPGNSSEVTGNVLFDSNGSNTCLISATITGTVQGFGVALTAGNTTFQFTLTDGGNTLSGSYVQSDSPPEGCSGQTGSGTMTLTRG